MSISDFTDCMPHTLFVSSETVKDKYGKPTYGSATAYTARVTYETRMVRDNNGDIVPSSGVAWMATTAVFSVYDKFEFERDTSVSPTILDRLFPIRIDTISDEDGFHHIKIHFK